MDRCHSHKCYVSSISPRCTTTHQHVNVTAGNFFSAAFENRCTAVVGASGGIFGLLGLFIADMVLNFETLTRCDSVSTVSGYAEANHFRK